jgi:Glyoxalase-like domain
LGNQWRNQHENTRRGSLFILACLEGTSALAASLLGSGLGVDHVGVVARDLDVAKSDFEGLGFTVSSGGNFPGGLSNKIINFENGTYV